MPKKTLTSEQKARKACYSKIRRDIIKNHGVEAWKTMIAAKAEKIRKGDQTVLQKYGKTVYKRMAENREKAEKKRKEAEIVSKYGQAAWIRMEANRVKVENKRKRELKVKQQQPVNIKTVPKAVKTVKKRSKKRKSAKTYEELDKGGQPTPEELHRLGYFHKSGRPQKKRYKPHDCTVAQSLYGENPVQGPDGKWYYITKDKDGNPKKVYCD